jgi:hypothetical protein
MPLPPAFAIRKDEEFRRWFGKSKVVDEAGNPKVVYHGTTKNFGVFKSRKRDPELGFHFGSISQAEWFATYDEGRGTLPGGNIRPVYLRIENPLRLRDVFVRCRRSSEDAAYWLYRDGMVAKADLQWICRAKTTRKVHDRFVVVVARLGYDGIVYENDQEGGAADTNEDSYAVFRPEQIRSVFEIAGRRPAAYVARRRPPLSNS